MEKVKKIYKTLLNNRVVSGSLIMVIGGFAGSFTNYLFHLVTARTLGPKDYGILDSLISLLYQLLIPMGTISLVIIKYVSSFKGQNRTKTIESFFWKLNKKLFFIIPLLFLAILIITPIITKFLHLPSPFLFIWLGFSFAMGIVTVIGRSFLQGLGRFTAFSVVGFSEGLLRLIFTIFLIYIGWGLLGAVFPFFLISIIALVFTMYLIKDLLKGDKNEIIPEKKEILKFFLPVFLVNLGATSLISSDVILARHFLPPYEAGLYSALSTLGKIIYFAASPVVSVIYPLISEHQAANKNYTKVALQGLLIIGLIIGLSFLIFSLFPKIMVTLLFGEKYFMIIQYVFYIAIALSLYTIDFAILNISLALKIVLPAIFVCLAAFAQIILIILFHQSIQQIINIFILVTALLLCSLLLYYALSSSLIKLKIGRQNSSPL